MLGEGVAAFCWGPLELRVRLGILENRFFLEVGFLKKLFCRVSDPGKGFASLVSLFFSIFGQFLSIFEFFPNLI